MSAVPQPELPVILEAILLTADTPLSIEQLAHFFAAEERISRSAIRAALLVLSEQCCGHSFELCETAGGYRLQTRADFRQWVIKHYVARPPKYSRAFLETLALIVWRQPITRAEIEAVRGVSVNTNIIKTLLEREWVRVVGHKEVPGRPEMLGTTRQFLDYFNLKSLDDLPDLADIKDLDIEQLHTQLLQLDSPDHESDESQLIDKALVNQISGD
ncbi:MAG: SMC-Scp complex subunit ScpB [Proteobacteria bacterium]|nr:MAG: SMC-Scp complex subunit ScpB [Pseudomonadota bacterium]